MTIRTTSWLAVLVLLGGCGGIAESPDGEGDAPTDGPADGLADQPADHGGDEVAEAEAEADAHAEAEADADADADAHADADADPTDVSDVPTVVCGNGLPERPEECDDGNAVEDDGCDNECRYSCHTDAECPDDGNLCTTETCLPITAVGRLCASSDNDLPCEDGDPCTGPDACADGAC